jgi:Rad3-related DNA helicase
MSRGLQLLFFMILLLCACRKEDPNPENFDPIYSDLVKRQAADESELAEEKKKLAKALEDLQAALPNTIDLKNAMRDRDRSIALIDRLEQKTRFNKIRTERRRVEDKLNYHNAFVANKDWPDKTEYERYLANQRLLEAPRNWDAHLPKLFSRAPAAAKKPEKKAEGGEE